MISLKLCYFPLLRSALEIIYLSSDWSRLIDDARPRLVRQLTSSSSSSSSRWVRNVGEERSAIRGEIRPSLIMRSQPAQSNLLPLEFSYQSSAPTRLLQIERRYLPRSTRRRQRGERGERGGARMIAAQLSSSSAGKYLRLEPNPRSCAAQPVPANLCVYK